MPLGFHRALGAAAVTGLLAGATSAHAQEKRPWVDPPAATAPAPKAEAPQPPAPAPEAAKSPAPAPAPAVASKPEPAPEREAVRPPKKRLARAKPKPAVEARRVESTRAAANRRSVASDRRDRVIREGGGPLELMTLRTIEFPDGRRVQVLMRPNPEAVSEYLGR